MAAEPVMPKRSPLGTLGSLPNSWSLCNLSHQGHIGDGHELTAQLQHDERRLTLGADRTGELLADNIRLMAQHAENRAFAAVFRGVLLDDLLDKPIGDRIVRIAERAIGSRHDKDDVALRPHVGKSGGQQLRAWTLDIASGK